MVNLSRSAPGSRQLLFRRSRATGELAYYRCYSPGPVPLSTLVGVARSRWRVAETFQAGRELAGLDEHQVRRYPSWSRWVTLAMPAPAFRAVLRADEHDRTQAPMTTSEVRAPRRTMPRCTQTSRRVRPS
ncbi:hypothetical protein [Streptomyces sp. CB01373]|uniref:hypothetical protein n=1 Tax=Streptomyces sp. CB01373 TaxID=2020325 RepID=UPI0026CBB5C2